jgi:hypothetical protein
MRSSSSFSDGARDGHEAAGDSHGSRLRCRGRRGSRRDRRESRWGRRRRARLPAPHGKSSTVARSGPEPRGRPTGSEPNLDSERRPRSERCARSCYRRARRWLPRRRELHARNSRPRSMTDRGKLCAVMTTVVGSGLGSEDRVEHAVFAKARLERRGLPPVRAHTVKLDVRLFSRRTSARPPHRRAAECCAKRYERHAHRLPLSASFCEHVSNVRLPETARPRRAGTPSRFASLRATARIDGVERRLPAYGLVAPAQLGQELRRRRVTSAHLVLTNAARSSRSSTLPCDDKEHRLRHRELALLATCIDDGRRLHVVDGGLRQ